MRPAWFVATALLLAAAPGCGILSDGSAAAVWTVAPAQSLDARTVEFTVMVSRLGCNGGVTGDVLKPEVELDDVRVVLTFAVQPEEPSLAPCPGNSQVRYLVELEEPLGDRKLVDGQCLPGGAAAGDSHCLPDGVRYDPGSGVTKPRSGVRVTDGKVRAIEIFEANHADCVSANAARRNGAVRRWRS